MRAIFGLLCHIFVLARGTPCIYTYNKFVSPVTPKRPKAQRPKHRRNGDFQPRATIAEHHLFPQVSSTFSHKPIFEKNENRCQIDEKSHAWPEYTTIIMQTKCGLFPTILS